MTKTSTRPAPPIAAEALLTAVSRAMVGLYKAQFGRGPSRTCSHWAGPDTIVCVLEDTLTPAERKLISLSQHRTVRDLRGALQYATVQDFCAPIEAITGRKVRAFYSSVDTVAEGSTVEAFSLHPVGYTGPGRSEAGFAAEETR